MVYQYVTDKGVLLKKKYSTGFAQKYTKMAHVSMTVGKKKSDVTETKNVFPQLLLYYEYDTFGAKVVFVVKSLQTVAVNFFTSNQTVVCKSLCHTTAMLAL